MKKLMLGLMMTFAVTAEATTYNYTLNESLTATLDDATGVLTINGDGAMPYWSGGADQVWRNKHSLIKSVVAEGEITIGNYAFVLCQSLTSVSLPNATTIGEYAFQGCQNLTFVSLPSATTIGVNAFLQCNALSALIVNDTMKSTLEANKRKYGIPDSTVITTELLPEEVVKAARYEVKGAVVETNLSVVVSTDVKVQPSVTLKSGETVLNEATYEAWCAYYGCTPLTKPETPEVPAEPTAEDFKVVSKGAEIVPEGHIAVSKESIAAPSAGTVKVEDKKVQLGVTVLKTSDLTAETKEWGEVTLTADDVKVVDGKIVISVPVDSASGFMVIQTKDAAK